MRQVVMFAIRFPTEEPITPIMCSVGALSPSTDVKSNKAWHFLGLF